MCVGLLSVFAAPVSDYEGVRRSICAWQEALYPQETHFNLFQLVAGIHHRTSNHQPHQPPTKYEILTANTPTTRGF